MADKSAIEWTDATWNPIAGCSIVSPGCTHCYAMKMAARIEAMGKVPHYTGLTQPSKAGPVWTGKVVQAPDHILMQPLRWTRPRRIFVNSMADLFHEDVADEAIDKVFAVMALAPQHTFQVLTKRSARMRAWFAERWQATLAQRLDLGGGDIIDIPSGEETGREHQVEQACEHVFNLIPAMVDTNNDKLWTEDGSLKCRQFSWPLPNVWLGVSTEDQTRADERIPDLLATPAAKRFVSAEPLLGALELNHMSRAPSEADKAMPGFADVAAFTTSALTGQDGLAMRTGQRYYQPLDESRPRLDWVIAGGESGPGARPSHPDWYRSLRDQCATAGVPFFFKQWGAWFPMIDRDKDDPDWRRDYRTDHERTRIVNLAGGTGFHGARVHLMQRYSKAGAGAQLDGREHRAFPT